MKLRCLNAGPNFLSQNSTISRIYCVLPHSCWVGTLATPWTTLSGNPEEVQWYYMLGPEQQRTSWLWENWIRTLEYLVSWKLVRTSIYEATDTSSQCAYLALGRNTQWHGQHSHMTWEGQTRGLIQHLWPAWPKKAVFPKPVPLNSSTVKWPTESWHHQLVWKTLVMPSFRRPLV